MPLDEIKQLAGNVIMRIFSQSPMISNYTLEDLFAIMEAVRVVEGRIESCLFPAEFAVLFKAVTAVAAIAIDDPSRNLAQHAS